MTEKNMTGQLIWVRNGGCQARQILENIKFKHYT